MLGVMEAMKMELASRRRSPAPSTAVDAAAGDQVRWAPRCSWSSRRPEDETR